MGTCYKLTTVTQKKDKWFKIWNAITEKLGKRREKGQCVASREWVVVEVVSCCAKASCTNKHFLQWASTWRAATQLLQPVMSCSVHLPIKNYVLLSSPIIFSSIDSWHPLPCPCWHLLYLSDWDLSLLPRGSNAASFVSGFPQTTLVLGTGWSWE
jgi:hypothetical protein